MSKLEKIDKAFTLVFSGVKQQILRGQYKINKFKKDSEYPILLIQYISRQYISENKKMMAVLQLTKQQSLPTNQLYIILINLYNQYFNASQKLADRIRTLIVRNSLNYSIAICLNNNNNIGKNFVSWQRLIQLGGQFLMYIEQLQMKNKYFSINSFQQIQIYLYKVLRQTNIVASLAMLDKLMCLFFDFCCCVKKMTIKHPIQFKQFQLDKENWIITFSLIKKQLQIYPITSYVIQLFQNNKSKQLIQQTYYKLVEDMLYQQKSYYINVLLNYFDQRISFQKIISIFQEYIRRKFLVNQYTPSEIYQNNNQDAQFYLQNNTRNQKVSENIYFDFLNQIIKLRQKQLIRIIENLDIQVISRLIIVLSYYYTPQKNTINSSKTQLLTISFQKSKQCFNFIVKKCLTQSQSINQKVKINHQLTQQLIGCLKFLHRHQNMNSVIEIIDYLKILNKLIKKNFRFSSIIYAFINEQIHYLNDLFIKQPKQCPIAELSELLFELISVINSNEWGITPQSFESPLIILQNISIKYYHESLDKFFTLIIQNLEQTDQFNTQIANLSFDTIVKVHKDNLHIKNIGNQSIKKILKFMQKKQLVEENDQRVNYLLKFI